MKKNELLRVLNTQRELTKKSTRKDIISLISAMVEYHIKDNSEIEGLSLNRSCTGINLGEAVEIIVKSTFRNKLSKSGSDKHYDALVKGCKVEIKFTTTDAPASKIYDSIVDYYLIVAYSKKEGGMIFKVPYANKNDIVLDSQDRPTTSQKYKYFDKELTNKVFAF